jgi:hypothetical protein
VGQEPYAIFVGDGEGGLGDLFAVGAGGGQVYQITFTRVDERGPALAPDGVMLAFLRSGGTGGGTRVVVMNLLNGAERDIPLPGGAAPTGLGWSRDGKVLYAATVSGPFRITPPPAEPTPQAVTAEDRAAADSSLEILLGQPAFATIIPCPGRAGLCLRNASGEIDPMDPNGRDATRWGGDSLGYFAGETFTIRPLGPGAARSLRWAQPPAHPRGVAYFPGNSGS